jgi:hypothetical protein
MHKIGIEAYDTTLAQHHPWVLKRIIRLGFNALVSKETFIKSYLNER